MQSVGARFTGARSGEGPLTWGQRAMWEALARNGQAWNLASLVDLRQRPVDVPTALGALGRLLARHESLRTVFPVVDGEPRQRVAGSGTLPVTIVPCAAADAEAKARQLWNDQHPFAAGTEMPVRVSLVVVDGSVAGMVLVFSHLAVDNAAVHIIEADLHRLLAAGGCDSEPGLQPLDVARREHGEGAAVLARAVRYWTEQLRRIPPTTLSPAGPAHEPRIQQADLTSSALFAAARCLAARHRTTPSTVLLAATAHVLGGMAGRSVFAMNVHVGNRFSPEYRHVTGNLVQLGLFVLDLPRGAGLDDLLPAAKQSALLTYRYGYYELAAVERARDQVNAERGVTVNPMCCFNMIDPSLNEPGGPIPSAEEIRAAQEESELSWDDDPSRSRCPFCLRVRAMQGEARVLSLAVDTAYLPPDRMEHFLRELERVLVEAACRG